MTTQTARKGQPGHIPEDRERLGPTPTRRAREIRARARILEQRRALIGFHDQLTGTVRPTFFGWLNAVYAQHFGEHAEQGRGRFESPTKVGPGRRPNAIIGLARRAAAALRPRFS